MSVAALDGGTVKVTDVDVETLQLNASHGGQLTVTGTCEIAIATDILNAAIAASDLTCREAALSTRRGADVSITATGIASIDDSLGGRIAVNGSPAIVDVLPSLAADAAADAEG